MGGVNTKLIQKLFHGTDRVFDNFLNHSPTNKWNNSGGGIFFTPDEGVATRFATGNRGGFGTIDPANMQDELLENIAEALQKDASDLTSTDIQTFIKSEAMAKDRKLYYYDSDGLIKKFEGNVDPESPLLMMREGYEPRIIEAEIYGNQFDLSDPKNVIEAIGKPKTNASRNILDIANNYKNDPRGYVYQMQGSYNLPPQATDLLETLKNNKYTNMKMPDAYESGFSSVYVPDVEANAVIKKIKPLGGFAGMAATPDMNPLPILGDAVNAYRDVKEKVYSNLAKQLDFSRTKNKEFQKQMTSWLSMAADPLNLISGVGGLVAPVMEEVLARQGHKNVP